MGMVMGSAMLAWTATCVLHARFTWLFTWAHRSIMAVAQAVGNVVLKEKRNYPYLPWSFFMAVWAPALAYWAWQRQYVACGVNADGWQAGGQWPARRGEILVPAHGRHVQHRPRL
jgi:hypothetical protein